MTLDSLNKVINILLELKFTLVGVEGLDNISRLITEIKNNNVKGAFVEAGVWRGGASIWARALMDYLEIKEPVYVCDSFQGLPIPMDINDIKDAHFFIPELSVSLNTVKENFGYFPLEGEVKYVEGLFKDTMPKLKDEIGPISILRVDADMYEGTTQVLENLYDKISVGGFIIVDDYCINQAKLAIDEFREMYNIKNPLIKANNCIHYWQK